MKYINTAVRVISMIVGGIVFGLVAFVLYVCSVYHAWAWGMLAGASSAIVVAVILAFVNYREMMKFEEAYTRVEGTVLEFSLATLCNFGRGRRVYFFLTAETIRLFLWDKKPYLESTLNRDEVKILYRSDRPNHMSIVVDGDSMEFSFPHMEDLLTVMRAHDYDVEEEHLYV